jgi:hypothetical protein
MATLNYTTKIPVGQTVGEIQQMLGEHGADAIMIRYTERQPSGVSFTLPAMDGRGGLAYTLPVDVDGMARSLTQQAKDGQLKSLSKAVLTSREHAARVAWRVVKDWLAAQLTLIASGMASLDQVMLPYLHVDGDRTLYQAYREQGPRAITGGTGA